MMLANSAPECVRQTGMEGALMARGNRHSPEQIVIAFGVMLRVIDLQCALTQLLAIRFGYCPAPNASSGDHSSLSDADPLAT